MPDSNTLDNEDDMVMLKMVMMTLMIIIAHWDQKC